MVKSRPVNRFFCALTLFLIANTVIVYLTLVFAFAIPWKRTSIFDTFIFFYRVENIVQHRPEQQGADSWIPMLAALDAIRSDPQKPVYTAVFFGKHIKFQYPPASLIPVRLMQLCCSSPKIVECLNWISWMMLLANGFLVFLILAFSIKRFLPDLNAQFSQIHPLLLALLSCFATLTFYPLIKAHTLGQIQVWINCLFAMLLFSWIKQKEGLAGGLAALISLLKPQYWLFLLWAILRRKKRFTRSYLIMALSGLSISVLLFGGQNHFNYLSVLSFLSKHGESYYQNQSFNGLLNRLLHNGPIVDFSKFSFPLFHPVVFIGTIVTTAALILLALFGRKTSHTPSLATPEFAADFCLVGLTCTLASPVAWEHHYGVLLPIFALFLPILYKTRGAFLALCGVAYFLVSNFFPIAEELTDAPFALNVLQSYVLAGGLILFALLFAIRSGRLTRLRNTAQHPADIASLNIAPR